MKSVRMLKSRISLLTYRHSGGEVGFSLLVVVVVVQLWKGKKSLFTELRVSSYVLEADCGVICHRSIELEMFHFINVHAHV